MDQETNRKTQKVICREIICQVIGRSPNSSVIPVEVILPASDEDDPVASFLRRQDEALCRTLLDARMVSAGMIEEARQVEDDYLGRREAELYGEWDPYDGIAM